MIKTINLRYSENSFDNLKKAKAKHEKRTGLKLNWEDFIWMKCMR